MILLLDIGNSRVKWGTLDQDELLPGGTAVHAGTDLPAILDDAWSKLARPERALTCNVAGAECAQRLTDWMRSAWDMAPEFILPQHKACGVINAYVEPQRLGADRWAALLAVHAHIPGAACIVDCGSAVTIDALAANGEHLGGLILPGLNMMRRALIKDTHIPDTAGGGQVSLLARDTGNAVNGGVLYALVAAIDRITADVARELRGPTTRVISGGDAERVLPLLAGPYRHEPHLVLRGLALLAQKEPLNV